MDPLAFSWKQLDDFVLRYGENKNCFNPRPCSCTILWHREETEDVAITHEDVADLDILAFARKPKMDDVQMEVRVIFSSPLNTRTDGDDSLTPSDPLPFVASTFATLVKECRLMADSWLDGQPIQSSSTKGPILSTSLCLRHDSNRPQNAYVLSSFNAATKIGIILCLNLSRGEISTCRTYLDDKRTNVFSIHPCFVSALILEIGVLKIKSATFDHEDGSYDLLRRAGHLNMASKDLTLDTEADAETALRIQESLATLQQMTGNCLSLCSRMKVLVNAYEMGNTIGARVKTTRKVISDRIDVISQNLEVAARANVRSLAWCKSIAPWHQVQNATRANKLNLEIAQQSRDIAIASKHDSAIMKDIAIQSKRDSSAMKAIAVLTMVFLPGTFFATLFALPFFNFATTESGPMVTNRFWIYWVVTLPTTVLVLAMWRTWYNFEEWKRVNGIGGLLSDIRRWLGGVTKGEDEESLNEE